MPRPIRIAIVDDHTLFREGLRKILGVHDDLQIVAESAEGATILDLVWESRPDVLLLDVRVPPENGIDAIPAVRRLAPRTAILVLTACDDPGEHSRALAAGANGIILKDAAAEKLVRAIRTVATGETWTDPDAPAGTLAGEGTRGPLTSRETEIVRLVAAGCRNREIGERLSISEKTVKTHLSNVFQKLGVRDRIELITYALRRRITEDRADG
jgi:two-component system NarL family response regulator